RHVLCQDVDFGKGLLHVRVTKNGKDRWIPLNNSLRELLERMRAERSWESQDKPIMRVFECQKSIDRGCRLVGVQRITHPDLRRLPQLAILGHKSPTSIKWQYQILPDDPEAFPGRARKEPAIPKAANLGILIVAGIMRSSVLVTAAVGGCG